MTNAISRFSEPVDHTLVGKILVPVEGADVQNSVLQSVVKRMLEVENSNSSCKRRPSYYNNGVGTSAQGW
jgi:hypothetical protein